MKLNSLKIMNLLEKLFSGFVGTSFGYKLGHKIIFSVLLSLFCLLSIIAYEKSLDTVTPSWIQWIAALPLIVGLIIFLLVCGPGLHAAVETGECNAKLFNFFPVVILGYIISYIIASIIFMQLLNLHEKTADMDIWHPLVILGTLLCTALYHYSVKAFVVGAIDDIRK